MALAPTTAATITSMADLKNCMAYQLWASVTEWVGRGPTWLTNCIEVWFKSWRVDLCWSIEKINSKQWEWESSEGMKSQYEERKLSEELYVQTVVLLYVLPLSKDDLGDGLKEPGRTGVNSGCCEVERHENFRYTALWDSMINICYFTVWSCKCTPDPAWLSQPCGKVDLRVRFWYGQCSYFDTLYLCSASSKMASRTWDSNVCIRFRQVTSCRTVWKFTPDSLLFTTKISRHRWRHSPRSVN